MKLAPNWWTILTKAWSMYFMAIAALLSGLEAAPAACDGYGGKTWNAISTRQSRPDAIANSQH